MKTFHQRLKAACDQQQQIVPEYGYGRQVFFARKLKVTQEAVRKWFTGEARPRPDKMKRLSVLLEVDEAWLALGVEPEVDRREKRRIGDKTDGAIYLLYGMFMLAGGHCAFPSDADPRREFVDFYAIIRAMQMAVHVSVGRETTKGVYEFILPQQYAEVRCLGVVHLGGMKFHTLDLTHDLIDKHKQRKAGGYSLNIHRRDNDYHTGADTWPRVTHPGDL